MSFSVPNCHLRPFTSPRLFSAIVNAGHDQKNMVRDGLDRYGQVEIVSVEDLDLESPTLRSESRRVEEQ